jgi:hypothetical protein
MALLVAAGGAAGAVSDNEVNATMIYKIGKFVHWPDGAFAANGGRLTLCVVGSDEVEAGLGSLEGRKLQGQVIAIVRLAVDGPAENCHIAFIGRSEQSNVGAFLDRVSKTPVLTISDIEGFAAQGGIVGIGSQDGKATLEINSGASRRAGLDIGAQLLQLATLVADARTGAKP